jgi:hypothetical protein
MGSTNRAAVVAVMVLILVANPALLAWGNPVPGRWEKVAETKPGEKMVIYTKDGAKNKYVYQSLDNEFLHCVNRYNGEVPIELEAIKEVVIPKAGKYAKHGALYGLLGGAGIGYLISGGGEAWQLGVIYIGGVGLVGGFLTGAVVGAPGETIYISKEAALGK